MSTGFEHGRDLIEVRQESMGGAPHRPSPFRVFTAEEMLVLPLPPREMALEPWLPMRALAMLHGWRGIGKTHVVLGCAYAIATGGRFLRWTAPKPRRVLLIDGEMSGNELQARLASLTTGGPPLEGRLSILPMDLQENNFNLGDSADQDVIKPILDGIEVIFLDNLSSLMHNGKENEAESWFPVQNWGLGQRRAGRTVVFVHHSGKGGAQRGTSRREDVLDTVVALRHPTDYKADQGARFEVHFEKTRGFQGPDAQPFEATLLPTGPWTTRDLSNADMARVVMLTEEGYSAREIADKTKMGKSTVNRLQQRAREVGLLGGKAAGHG